MLAKASLRFAFTPDFVRLLTLGAFVSCLLARPSNAQTDALPEAAGGGTLLNPPARTYGPLGASGSGMQYHGGPIMLGTPNIYFIWYGNWAGNSAVDILTDWANNIGGSPYYNINTTYYNGSGVHLSNSARFAGSVLDNYSHGFSLSGDDVRAVITDQINAHALPADANGVYFVLTSADVDQRSGFCTDYCGWHSAVTINGTNIKHAFVGNADRCPSFCAPQQARSPNDNVGADAMASILSHEFEETTSDPNLDAWYQPPEPPATGISENGDLCAWTFGNEYRTPNGARANMRLGNRDYLIQQNWVNADGGYCALSLPSVIGVTPNRGPRAGGTLVTISGRGFGPSTSVTFGGRLATAVTFVNTTTLTAITPSHAFGDAAVRVSVSGQPGEMVNAFFYALEPAQIMTVVNAIEQ